MAAEPGTEQLSDEVDARTERALAVDELLAGLNPPQREAVTYGDGPLLDPRRRRLGQDARAHAPHRLPRAHRAGAGGRDPRDHLHEQGGAGDARARRAPARPPHARDVGDDLPLGLRAHAARRGAAAGLLEVVHDLRPGRLAAPDQARPRRPRRRPQALHAGGDRRADLGRQEQAARRRRLPPDGGLVLRADRGRRLRPLRARDAPRQRDGLRRPARARGQRARAVPGGPRALREHLPPRARRRVPGHQPRAVPLAAAAGRRAPQPGRGRRRRPVPGRGNAGDHGRRDPAPDRGRAGGR